MVLQTLSSSNLSCCPCNTRSFRYGASSSIASPPSDLSRSRSSHALKASHESSPDRAGAGINICFLYLSFGFSNLLVNPPIRSRQRWRRFEFLGALLEEQVWQSNVLERGSRCATIFNRRIQHGSFKPILFGVVGGSRSLASPTEPRSAFATGQ